ncbi:unnamed protein product [Kluyveromyces dobzhanskii CBS 2104]|uniref:WGS project CCBQ000000000 data, contig 00058 n=1 Tax=Kluyveromyces dobzhanskii CBS 2104 TaxID=1427455 RepID=A0A0A8LCE3_9SACH|nr:unnamed protein product [Kluyveromyces dobzhanskii CBS 2104]
MSEDYQELCIRIDPASCGFNKDDHVVITGDFDNWNPGRYVLNYDSATGYYTVRLPYDGCSDTFICKFVVNYEHWRALNCFDKYVDAIGHENNLIYCKAWLQPEEIVADIIMEDVELDLKPLKNSMSPSELLMDQLNIDRPGSEHDYIHITSRGELSSSEDVELDPRSTPGAIDDTLILETDEHQPQPAASQEGCSGQNTRYQISHNPIHGLVTTLRRATTYWKR